MHLKRLKMYTKTNRRISFWVSKDKLESIKLKIYKNKNFSTMNGVNDLVMKIDSKSISRDEAINSYNDVSKKGEKIAKLRQTKNRPKFWEIINSLKKIFDKQPDTTDMPDLESEGSAAQRRKQQGLRLEILTPNQMLSRLPITLA